MNIQLSKNTKISALALLPAVIPTLLSGAVVYSENADSLIAGTSTLNDSTNWNGNAGDYGVVAGGALFTTNHFELTVPDTNFNFANRDEGVRAIMTFSGDFVDLGTTSGTIADAGVRLAFRHQTGGSTFFDLLSSTVPDNTIVHYDYVMNNTNAAVTFEDGVTTIAANTVELWLNGAMVGSKATANGNPAIGFGLWSRRPESAFLADNLEIRDTAFFVAAVPEPSSLGLAALGLLGLARRRRS